MKKDTTNRLATLTEESADVLEEAVEEALPLAEQEDTERRSPNRFRRTGSKASAA